MPHLRILFKEDKVNGDILNESLQGLLEIVAKNFDENPDYVSADITIQSKWVKNRKDVDIELDSSPDEFGKRAKCSQNLAEEMGNYLKNYLRARQIDCELSSWVRIFETGNYAYVP